MACVILGARTRDEPCVEASLTGCIYPQDGRAELWSGAQLSVDPNGCVDCGACVPVRPTNSIHVLDEVPADEQEFIENAARYA